MKKFSTLAFVLVCIFLFNYSVSSQSIDCPVDTIVSADIDSCTADVGIIDPDTTLIGVPASSSFEVTITNSNGEITDIASPGMNRVLDTLPLGVTTVSYNLIQDDPDGTEICSYSITVVDEQAPEVLCPGDTVLFNDPGVCGAVYDYTLTINDNCDGTSGAGSASILFVADDGGITELPGLLTMEGYNVTTVLNDYNVGTTENTVLTGNLSSFDLVVWNAVGVGSGSVHGPMTTSNLESYVQNGGNLFITGYDVIASPNDPNLIGMMGGTSSLDFASDPSSVQGPANNLNSGLFNIIGLSVPISGDEDRLIGLSSETISVLPSSGGPGDASRWSLRTIPGGGQVAWVSTTQRALDPNFPEWNTPGSGYYEAIRNFAFNTGISTSSVQTSGFASGSVFPVGTTTNTFVVTDAAGNTSSCSFTVTVQDTSLPVITCPTDAIIVTSDGGTGNCEGIFTYDVPTATDECGLSSYTVRYINPDGTEDGPYDLQANLKNYQDTSITRSYQMGTTVVEFYAEDPSGNSDTCSFTVNVTDDEDPSFVNCPVDTITVGNDFNNCAGGVNWSIPVAEDNCNVDSVSQTAGPVPGQILAVGVYNIEYTAYDPALNTATCNFVVEVIDTQSPIVGCPADLTVAADQDSCSWTSDPGSLSPAVAIENCEPELTYTVLNPDSSMTSDSGDVSGYIFDLGTSEVTYVLTDSSGTMSDTCSFRVTVEDEQDPVIICPGDTSLANDPGECGTVLNYDMPMVDDNCPLNIMSGMGTSDTFAFTGAAQTYTVPAGVDSVFIQSFGAQGGGSEGLGIPDQDDGGLGGFASGVLAVTPGQVLNIYVGGKPGLTGAFKAGGFNGGGDAGQFGGAGGGASDIRVGGIGLADRVIVAGGGGGGNTGNPDHGAGGAGGGLMGDDGVELRGINTPGGGATQFGGGTAGTDGTPGSLGQGGSNAGDIYHIAGGGGGWYGGGGAYAAGAGGGSSYIGGVANGSTTSSTRMGDGMVIINELSSSTPLVQTSGLPSGSLFPVGTTTNTFVITDESGNTNSCSFTVTVLDTEAPSIMCPSDTAITTGADGNVDCAALYNWDHPVPVENCEIGDFTVTYFNPDGSIDGPSEVIYNFGTADTSVDSTTAARHFQVGTTTVFYYVEDAAGNNDTCSFKVTVTDDENPSFVNCPVDTITVGNDVNNCNGGVNWSIPVAEDNCGVDTVQQIVGPAPGSVLPVGVTEIAYETVDAAGNADTCTFFIEVLDTQGPLLACPADLTFANDLDSCNWTSAMGELNTVVAVENCEPSLTYEITDADGNMVQDSGQVMPYTFPLGENEICYTLTDSSGMQMEECCFTVTVIDEQDPTIECPADTIVYASNTDCGVIVEYDSIQASDNCSVILSTVEQDDITTLFATNNGQAGAMFDVENVSSEPITIDSFYLNLYSGTVSNIEVYFASGSYIGNETNASAWTLLGSEAVSSSGDDVPSLLNVGGLMINPGESYGIFIIDYPRNGGMNYTDGSNTYNNGDLEIRAGIGRGADGGTRFNGVIFDPRTWNGTVHYTTVNTVSGIVQTDNSGLTSGSFFSVGTTIQEYTAFDETGNSSSCSFEVTVLDTISPEIISPSDTMIFASAGECEGQYEWEDPNPTDNCNIALYSVRYINPDGTMDGPFDVNLKRDGFQDSTNVRDFELGTSVVEYYVEDPSGNSDTTSFLVTVIDDESPEFVNCPTDTITVGNDVSNCDGGVNWSIPVAEDNCGVDTVQQIAGPAPGSVLPVGVTEIAYEAVDAAGNADTCTFFIEVLDTQAPLLACPADLTVANDLDSCSWTSAMGELNTVVAVENCEPSLTYEITDADGNVVQDSGQVMPYTFPLGENEICYTLTDSSGMQMEECCFTVTVIDEQVPTIVCPMDITVENDPALCGAVVEFSPPVIDDNCPIAMGVMNVDTFNFTGSPQSLVVPAGVTSVTIEAFGAEGGTALNDSVDCIIGGLGGYATGELDVTPGETIYIYVGGRGYAGDNGGWNGGGDACDTPSTCAKGGGASDVRQGGTSLSDRVIVAAGGGGAEWSACSGSAGDGGGLSGQDGAHPSTGARDGKGGTQVAGGAPGVGGYNGTAGTFGIGGAGGTHPSGHSGSGGGGWYGGGGSAEDGHAGGGSSYIAGVMNGMTTSGGRLGDGLVVISYGQSIQQTTGLPSGSVFPVGTTTNAFVVTDGGGNTVECSFDITVEDNEAPVIECPSDTIISTEVAGTGNCEVQYAWNHPLALDNCSLEDYLVRFINPDGSIEGLIDVARSLSFIDDSMFVRNFEVGITTIEYYIVDPSGNTDSCSFTVEVLDETVPSFVNCPTDTITVGNDVSNCDGGVNWSIPVAEDNCGVDAVQQITGPAPGSVLPVGVTEIAYEAVDAAGNTDTCTFFIEVLDTQAPLLACPADLTVANDLDSCSWTSAMGELNTVVAVENCEPSLTYEITDADGNMVQDSGQVMPYTFPLGENEICYTLTDSSGMQMEECCFTVTVIDDQNPTIECPMDITVENDLNFCGAVVEFDFPVIDDNCPIVMGGTMTTDTFVFTGTSQTFTVPSGVDSIFLQVFGAQGGNAGSSGVPNAIGGLGGYATGTLPVSSGEVLNIYVGGQGAEVFGGSAGGGFNGGGNANEIHSPFFAGAGGGATDLRQGGNTLSDRVIVAGGGGGAFDGVTGGFGGGLTGGSSGGQGGTQVSGGMGSNICGGSTELDGSLGMGGSVPLGCSEDGSGGGGGYYGGGVGLAAGGGSSYIAGVQNGTTTSGVQMGDGMIIITYNNSLQQTAGLPSGSVFPVGTTTNTFVVTDGSGNTAECSFDITVEDTQAPEIECPVDTIISTELAGTGDCAAQYAWEHPVPVENCETQNYVVQYINPDGSVDGPFDVDIQLSLIHDTTVIRNFDVGITQVEYYVEDPSGNTDSCSFTVEVLDETVPSFVNCPTDTITVGNDVSNCDGGVNWSIPVAEDNCGVDVVQQIVGPAPGSVLPVGVTEISYEAVDAAGNADTCTFFIEVLDTQAPLLACPADLTVANDLDSCSWTSAMGELNTVVAVENCEPSLTYEITDADGNMVQDSGQVMPYTFPLGENEICYTLTDSSGMQMEECCFTVTVIDEQDPTIECPMDIAVENDSALCGAVVEFDPPVIDDNCPIGMGLTESDTFAFSGALQNFTVPTGVNSVYVQIYGAQGGNAGLDGVANATGGLGGFASGNLAVTPGETLNLYVGGQGSEVFGGSAGGGFNGGGNANEIHSPYYAGAGGGASDIRQGGNSLNDRVIVAGGGGGAFDSSNGGSGGGLTGGSSDGQGGSQVSGGMGSNICGGSTELDGSLGMGGSVPLGCEADGSGGGGGYYGGGVGLAAGGGSSYIGGVQNSSTISGVQQGNGLIIITYNASLQQTAGLPSGSIFPVGTTTNTFVVTDGAGNTAECSFDVTVEDTEAPSIECPVDTIISTDLTGTGNCEAQYAWNHPVPTDNCETGSYVVRYVNPDGTIDGPFDVDIQLSLIHDTMQVRNFEVGITQVEYYVEDPSGNTDSCSFTVEVLDETAPVITNCPGDIVQDVDGGMCSAIVNFSPIAALDACDGSNVTIEYMLSGGLTQDWTEGQASGLSYPLDTTMVSYRAIDSVGNISDTCTFHVIIVENQAPDAICQDITVYLDSMGQVSITADSIDGGSYDNCGVDTLIASRLDFSCADVGDNPVSLTVIDTVGNTDSCIAIVTVLDTLAPSFDCPADMTVSGCSGTVPDLISGLSGEDNCDTVTFVQDPPAGVTFGPNANDTVNVLITATDANGNTSSCEVRLTIIDDENPYFQNCPDSLVVANDPGICGAFVNFSAPVAFDNCDDSLDVTQTMGLSPGSEFPVGRTFIQYEAVDDDGNSIFCEFEVIVRDLEAPTAVCQDVDVVVSADCEVTITPEDVDGGSTDNCGIDSFLISIDGINYFDSLVLDQEDLDPQPTNVYLKVIDSSGNESICTGDFEVFDVDNPEVICQEDVTVSTEPDACYGIVPNVLPPIDTSDNCFEIRNIEQTPPPGIIFGSKPGDSLEVFVIVEDTDGNRDTCSLFAHLEDNQAPEFVNCPRPIIQVKAMPGMCGAFVNFSLPLAQDNCTEVEVIQIDTFGLTSGDMFPVGATVLQYIAVDPSGNQSDTCSLKIVVNDEQQPTISCPGDLTVGTDGGECLATVTGIGAEVEDNCPENTTVIYRIENLETGSVQVGFDDASGSEFSCGDNEVTYRVQDESLVLITEITQELEALNGGTDPIPGYISAQNPVGDDYAEIMNFGPADMNMSCVTLERVGLSTRDTFDFPLNAIVESGEVFTIHFGGADDNDTTQNFYNDFDGADLDQDAPATYILSFEDRILDVVAVNGGAVGGQGTVAVEEADDFTGNIPAMDGFGGAYRVNAYDRDDAADFALSDLCIPATIGSVNPGIGSAEPSGAQYGFQLLDAAPEECEFTVTVEDTEAPSCGMLTAMEYTSTAQQGTITGGTFTSVIPVPDNFVVGDVNILDLDITHANAGDLTVKLMSPNGTVFVLWDRLCEGTEDVLVTLDSDTTTSITDAPCGPLGSGDTYAPVENMEEYIGEMSSGDWTLTIYDATADADGSLNGWTLELSAQEVYAQGDTILENELGLCGASFAWTHPTIIDNCLIGNVLVDYSSTDSINVPLGGEVVPGTPAEEFFEVGTTTVTYTIVDKMGNTGSCSFEVTVEDVELPELECPEDMTISLSAGECDKIVNFTPQVLEDNCAIDTLYSSPASGSVFEIGTTTVTVVAEDVNGNVDSCMFDITIEEFIPTTPGDLTCNDTLNVSLNAECEALITADMILEGNDYGCYEDYCIEVLDINGNPIAGNIVTQAQTGQCLEVTVTNCLGNGNSCTSVICIEDKLVPTFECPQDTFVFCNETYDPALTGEPVLTSCEESVTMEYSDRFLDGDFCGEPRAVIERIWTVTDESGNAATCEQIITVKRFSPADVEFPDDYDDQENPSISCIDWANDPTLTDPENTGVPTINGTDIMTPQTLCPMTVSYEDDTLKICEGTYDILREWEVYDPCQDQEFGVNPFYYLQRIRILDDVAPVLDCPAEITLATDPRTCFADFDPAILNAQVVDECSGSVNIEVRGNLNSSILPIGTHTFEVIATDACGNVATCETQVTVVDDVVPVAICDQNTKVGIGADGRGFVRASTIDDGSYDNCAVVKYEVVRMQRQGQFVCDELNVFSDRVWFCCEDIGEEVQVILRVTDASGNTNECMVNVLVEDKLPPVLVAPPNITVSCEYPYDVDNLSADFGTVANLLEGESREDIILDDPAIYACDEFNGSGPINWGEDGFITDNCFAQVEVTEQVNIDDCGEGSIIRVFTARDAEGNQIPGVTAVQRITVRACEFVEFEDVDFPDDVLNVNACQNGGTGPDVLGRPTWDDAYCGRIATSYEDEVFTVVDSACYKILRTWKVIDWCQFDEDTGEGLYTDVQVIKVTDMDDPVIDSSPITVCDTTDGCEGFVELMPEVTDECTPGEFLEFSYQIDAFNDGSIDLSGNTQDASGVFPYGTHRLIYTVSDLCGNETTEEILFTVEDCKKPTPVCFNGLATVVMPETGSISLSADYFDAGSFDNCTPSVDLELSYSSDVTDTERMWTCADFTDADTLRVEIELWVTDAAGNQQFCRTYLEIQDNDAVCPDGASGLISGEVALETGAGVGDVEVILESPNRPTPQIHLTNMEGLYSIPALLEQDYELSSGSNADILNGVTTWDLTLIQRHILQLHQITSPYQLIAADVNRDGRISGKDLTELRRVILGLDRDFRNNESWQMVDAAEDLPPAMVPQGYAQVIDIEDMQGNLSGQDFTAVKIGDVNHSVDLRGGLSEGRTDRVFELEVPVREVAVGEEIRLEVRASEALDLDGYQFTLGFDGHALSYQGIEAGVLAVNAGHVGAHRVSEGLLSTSWNTSGTAQAVNAGDVLFKIVYRVNAETNLRETLEVNSEITRAEAYVSGEVRDVSLRFTGGVAEEFALHQNTPNPFKEETVIPYTLPRAGQAQVTIYNARGQVLLVKRQDAKAGMNTLRIGQSELGASGVMYYRLESGEYTATKKMIVVRE